MELSALEIPPFPTVVERGLTAEDPIPAGSWPFELVFIRSQRCPCGGQFQILGTEVFDREDTPLEVQDTACSGCQRTRPFWFSIERFHGDPLAARRFEDLRRLFEEGVKLVEEEAFREARERFREVAAREPWFAVAHYHLGMIAMMDDDLDEARQRLETAVGIMPLDSTIHHSLAELWARADDDARAARAAWIAMTLEATLDAETDDG